MASLASAALAAIITAFVYLLEWATTPIPLAITFAVAWLVLWFFIRLGRGDAIEEIFDAFFIIWLIHAITD
jgi:hypothetical protein